MDTEKKHDCSNCERSKIFDVEHASDELIHGWRLGMASACVFLLPLLGALAGVVIANIRGVGELIGGVAGLMAGFALALAISRFFRK